MLLAFTAALLELLTALARTGFVAADFGFVAHRLVMAVVTAGAVDVGLVLGLKCG